MRRTPELTGFCRETWPRLVGALSLMTGDRHVAEELAQEALVRVCERWDEVRAMESPLGWTHRVAFNLASSHFRRRSAERR
ncbi:MAG TPA: sigma factor, partial [Nocardioides sp.]|nr:sigma factor [Nocardioides sp.]